MYTQSNFANGNEHNFSRSEEPNRRESFPTTAREHPVFSPSDLRPRHLNAARSALFLAALTFPCARNPLRSWLPGSRSQKVSRSHSLLISFLRFVPFPAICFVVAIFLCLELAWSIRCPSLVGIDPSLWKLGFVRRWINRS